MSNFQGWGYLVLYTPGLYTKQTSPNFKGVKKLFINKRRNEMGRELNLKTSEYLAVKKAFGNMDKTIGNELELTLEEQTLLTRLYIREFAKPKIKKEIQDGIS